MLRYGAVIAMALLALFGGPRAPHLVWNATPSAPVGLYRLVATTSVAKGALVLATPPRPVALFAAARGYLPLHVPLVKYLAARGGDRVCSIGRAITINGTLVAFRLPFDSRGRPLPHWQGCLRLSPGTVFLLNRDAADSFDGRYFGPVSTSAIRGHLEPLWTR